MADALEATHVQELASLNALYQCPPLGSGEPHLVTRRSRAPEDDVLALLANLGALAILAETGLTPGDELRLWTEWHCSGLPGIS